MNESEIARVLRREGFVSVVLERMSVREQASLFAGADIVVGVHGAGLSNIAFCRPGTAVVEIFAPEYVNVLYWAIAEAASLKYAYCFGSTPGLGITLKEELIRGDLVVSADKLVETIRLAAS